MTRTLVAAVAGMAISLVSVSALADPPAPTAKVLRTVTVVGKRQLPSVVIEIARLSAAVEAGAAHETFHAALVNSTAPAAPATTP